MTPRRRARGTPGRSEPPAEVLDKAATLRRLEVAINRRLDGTRSGEYLGAVVGPGSERAHPRRYTPGDDARRIDWNLSARALEPHLRDTDADRELDTWVVADRSASLDFGTARREKREVVLAATAAFGLLTVRSGNRFGVVMSGGSTLRQLPPASGRHRMMAALSAVYDTPRYSAAPPNSADLAAALSTVHRLAVRRGQVVVVSDFLDATDWAAPLRRLALRHQVVAVQVSDPREFELPDVGLLLVTDTETGRHLHVPTSDAAVRGRYTDAATARQERILAAVRRAAAEHLQLSTDRDWVRDVVEFVVRRRSAVAATRRAAVRA